MADGSGKERHEEAWIDLCAGIKKRSHYPGFDEYLGTADALVSAGLVGTGQFPGMPGMRRMRVTVLPDGSLPKGAPTANCREAKEPGARKVERARGGLFRVTVNVTVDEERMRVESRKNADQSGDPCKLDHDNEAFSSTEDFRNMVVDTAGTCLDILLRRTNALGMSISDVDRQHIVRIREELLHLMKRARIVTAKKPALRLVVSN